jgi:hypothetical protein
MEHDGKGIELSLNLAGNHNNASIIDALRKAYGLTARHKLNLKNRAGYRILLNESFYEDGMEVFVSVEEHEEEEKGLLARWLTTIDDSNVFNRMEPMLPASAILSDDLNSHANTGNNDIHSHENLFHSERSKQPQNNANPSTSGSFALPAIYSTHEQITGIGRRQQSSHEAGTDLELHFHTEAPGVLKTIVERQDGPSLDLDAMTEYQALFVEDTSDLEMSEPDDFQFRRSEAIDFPDVSGEEQRNAVLPQIRVLTDLNPLETITEEEHGQRLRACDA